MYTDIIDFILDMQTHADTHKCTETHVKEIIHAKGDALKRTHANILPISFSISSLNAEKIK